MLGILILQLVGLIYNDILKRDISQYGIYVLMEHLITRNQNGKFKQVLTDLSFSFFCYVKIVPFVVPAGGSSCDALGVIIKDSVQVCPFFNCSFPMC